jgi:hypothetical protein
LVGFCHDPSAAHAACSGRDDSGAVRMKRGLTHLVKICVRGRGRFFVDGSSFCNYTSKIVER